MMHLGVRGGEPGAQAALLLLAASVCIGLLVAIQYHPRIPYWPDEHVYVQTALRLAATGRGSFRDPGVEIVPASMFYERRPDGDFTSIYAPGFPRILAAAYRVGGVWGMRATNLGLALALVGLTFVVARRTLGTLVEGATAASLLAVNPVLLRYAASYMSDVAGAAAVLAAIAIAGMVPRLRGVARDAAAAAAGLAILGGVLVRPAALLALFPVGLLLFARGGPERSGERRLRDAAATALGLALPPVALFAATFLSPSETIGGVRLAQIAEGRALALFELETAGRNLVDMAKDLASPTSGALFVPALLGLALLGRAASGTATLLVAWMLPTMLLAIIYTSGEEHLGDLRHVLPALPALAVAAAAAAGAAGRVRRLPPVLGLVAGGALAAVGAFASQTFLADWQRRIPPTAGAVAIAGQLPPGSVLLAGRIALQAIALHRHDLYLVTTNLIERTDDGPVVPIESEVIGWRLDVTRLPWEWPALARANSARLAPLVAERGEAYVLVRDGELDACMLAFQQQFKVTSVMRSAEFPSHLMNALPMMIVLLRLEPLR